MGLWGELNSFSFSGIVNLIHSEGKTGELVLSNGKISPKIFFRGGQIIFFTGVLSNEMRLGSLLKSNKLISDEQLLYFLDKSKKLNKKLGEVLVQNGIISKDILANNILLQIRETIHGLLLWKEGKFEFKEGLDNLPGEMTFELDPRQIVLEGKKWLKLRQAVPHERIVFQTQKEASKKTSKLKSEEVRILFLIDGKRDVQKLLAETRYPKYFLYSTLYKFLQAGVIIHKEVETSGKDSDLFDYLDELKLLIAVIRLIIENLKEELGRGVNKLIEQCKKNLDGFPKFFLETFSFSEDMEENVKQIRTFISRHNLTIKSEDPLNTFNQIAQCFLNQQLKLLGSKSVLKSIAELEKGLPSLPGCQSKFGKQILNTILGWKKNISGR